MSNFIPTIGLEMHVQLKTKAKIFSHGANTYGESANTQVSAIDLGLPGVLPIINKGSVLTGLKACLALNMKINKEMHFDRKNYFYPDLPKGYQITQNKTPIGYDGFLEVGNKRIRIERIHLEEDTAQSVHYHEKTLMNYNRSGIGLIELVTYPDISSGKEAIDFINALREIFLYLNVSDMKMAEGSMRCDVNISLRRDENSPLGTKIEIKNIGAINSIKEAIEYEIKRQTELLNNGIVLKEETRRYDEASKKTIFMRSKETNLDYRYFIEPDLPPLILSDEEIDLVKTNLPLLPNELRQKYENLGLNKNQIEALINNIVLNEYYLTLLDEELEPISTINILSSEIISYLNKYNISIKEMKMQKEDLIKSLKMYEEKEISLRNLKQLINSLLTGISYKEAVSGLEKEESNDDIIMSLVTKILDDNVNMLEEYEVRKERVLKYLMGQIMKESRGSANPVMAATLLEKEIERRK